MPDGGMYVNLHYYPETDSLYVEFKARPGADTIEVTGGLNVDLDVDGEVVGFAIDRAFRHIDLAGLEADGLPQSGNKKGCNFTGKWLTYTVRR